MDLENQGNASGSAGKIGDVIADAAGVFNYTITGNDTVEVKSMAAKGKTKKAVKISAFFNKHKWNNLSRGFFH